MVQRLRIKYENLEGVEISFSVLSLNSNIEESEELSINDLNLIFFHILIDITKSLLINNFRI